MQLDFTLVREGSVLGRIAIKGDGQKKEIQNKGVGHRGKVILVLL